ncbi:DUF480 domain-containing protein [Tessaracoccus sp. MC1679]|uniref:DUF480 domain-containing protein n=1 Tax=Tessaracoccus sp. MC1679 TaxID=2760313 RepID=UPI0015FF32EA|nr:DUF480 domain-containing protein [Tessaracoccus sp. MC1679]
MTLPILTAEEQRVLGCLLEKEITVPDTYPLTLNALRSACNQKNSREPVVEYDERTVQDALRSLKERGWVRVTWLDYGKRTLKYAQSVVPALGLADDERALLTLLLLRGPQSAGELKTRAERLRPFADRAAVEACLASMVAREEPLVIQLERKPGQQDARWLHLLGEPPVGAAPAGVDREQVLAEGAAARDADVVAAYDAVAAAYAEDRRALGEFEEWFLARIVKLAGPHRTADVGCGAGAVTAFLAEEGADPVGIDVSTAMIAEAAARHPNIDVEVGDMRRLLRPTTAAGWGAVVAWHSLAHFAPSELGGIIRGLAEVLLPDGVLALAMETGATLDRRDEWFGHAVNLTFVRHDVAEVRRAVEAAGLGYVETYLVSDDEPVERLYLIACG